MKSFPKTLFSTGVAAFLLAAFPAGAEDIDIYSAETGLESNPNVLIIIDNSANWSSAAQHWPGGIKQGQSELNAVRTVVEGLGTGINIGLMLFTEGIDGGYVRYHMRPMTEANKDAFSALIGNPAACTDGPNALNGTPNCIYHNFDDPGEKVGTAKTDYSAALFEAFKYFGGYTSPAHAQDDVAGTPTGANAFGPFRYCGAPDPKSDADAFIDAAKSQYKQVITDEQNCAGNYVIFIGNGFPNQDSPASLLSGVGGDTSQVLMPDFEEGGKTETEHLETSACGVYSSVAECEAGARAKYGDAYESYSCTAATTCSSGAEVTSVEVLGTTACGAFEDAQSCREEGIPYEDTATTTYSCQELSSSCPYTLDLTEHALVANPSECIPDSVKGNKLYDQVCIDWITPREPDYTSFVCQTSPAPVTTGCPNKAAKWVIKALQEKKVGRSFTKLATTKSISAIETTGYNVFGTRTVHAVTPTGTSSPPPHNKIRYADEWTRFLNQTDVSSAPGQQNVTTYTIDVYKDKQDMNQTALLLSMARAGGGKYFAAMDENDIVNALRKILTEIQSVNSVFASSSLPVSVNTQGTYLNQVFIGMFRPDSTAAPRWAGNLKQYQFKFFVDEMKLADKEEEEAISATTGFITPCADSMWTTDSGPYWNFPGSQATGSCTAQSSRFPTAGSSSFHSDAPDGDVVEKGGAAQRLRGVGSLGTTLTSSSTNYAGRNLKTCDGSSVSSCTSFTSFNTANSAITAGALAVLAEERTGLIDWVRGKDVDDEDADGEQNEVRPSVHGGVIHSQPAVIDYGGDIGVIAFYGADDGVFHAVTGGTEDTDGMELWGFIAPETYGRLRRLRDNSPLIAYPNIGNVTPAPRPKDYFFDGSIGVLQDAGTTWIFPTMRRGGRAVYAFDVSDPANPSIKWRRGCFTHDVSNDSACATGWSEIGQTWSKPIVTHLSGYVDGGGKPKPVLVFGGGYDTCEDADNATPSCGASPKGANVWFVDADTGTLLRKYPTSRSVPGDVAVIQDKQRNTTYVYAADTGGHIYRINVGSYDGSAFNGWSDNTDADTIRLASLADGEARKFLFGPDVVPYKEFNAVIAGTGDRERPLWENYPCNQGSGGVLNRAFMIKDVVPGMPATPITTTDLLDVSNAPDITADDTALVQAKGWRFDLNTCEQVVNKPLTFAGTVYFGTNEPAAVGTACGRNLGIARGYAVKFLTGNPALNDERFVEYTGGGLPPSPVAGVVDVDGEKVPFIIGGDEESPFQGGEVEISPPARRNKQYWYMDAD
ncbi:MAG: hypothetical protein WDA11_05790 [Thiohalomonadaceae bacterium]